jgi:hypothetical protein
LPKGASDKRGKAPLFILCTVRYVHALRNPDEIDQVVTPDARFHDLEAIGYPKGPEGLKAFRRWLNARLPDENGLITAMCFGAATSLKWTLTLAERTQRRVKTLS